MRTQEVSRHHRAETTMAAYKESIASVRALAGVSTGKSSWNVKITLPSPSMSQDKIVFFAETYQEAVAFAQGAFRLCRRTVTLGSGEYGMECWHYIATNGVATDRCTNSGVPEIDNLLKN